MCKYRKSKGFTLIELIITLAISSLIMITLGSLLSASLRSYNNDKQQSQIQVDARNVITIISQNVRSAISTSISANGKELTLYGIDGKSTKVYSLVGSDLKDTKSNQVIKSDVSDIKFTKDKSTDNVFIYLTTKIPNTKKHYTVASSVADNSLPGIPSKFWFNNTFNIIDPTSTLDYDGVVLNPNDAGGRLLYVVDRFIANASGNPNNVAVKANSANLNNFATASGQYLFDVGSVDPISSATFGNGENYFSDSFFDSKTGLLTYGSGMQATNPRNQNKLSNYGSNNSSNPNPIWKSIFPYYPNTDTFGDDLEIAQLSDIDLQKVYDNLSKAGHSFKNKDFINHVHYYNSVTHPQPSKPGEVDYEGKSHITFDFSTGTPMYLNDASGNSTTNTVSYYISKGSYEYIVCKGDLVIDGENKVDSYQAVNLSLKYKGLIYCTGNIYTNIDLDGSGIIVAKGVINYKDSTGKLHSSCSSVTNWHQTYDDNMDRTDPLHPKGDGMDDIAALIDGASE